MKISVLQENLNKAVSAAARSVAARPQLPVLANILLEAKQGKLTVAGTDLVTTVALSVGGKVEAEGALTVPAKDLAAIIGSLPAGRVEMVAEKGALKLKSGSFRATLLGMPATEFPSLPQGTDAITALGAADFQTAVKRGLFAVSADEGRPVLTGIRFQVAGDGLRLAATDGYRLSLVSLPTSKIDLSSPIVVPGKTLAEIVHLVSGDQVQVWLTTDRGVVFSFDGGWVAGRLLAGEFPPAEKIVPPEADIWATVSVEELERAVRIAAIFSRESANVVRWEIRPDKLIVRSKSAHVGENESVMEAQTKGAGEIAFNARYVLDCLGSIEAERVSFQMVNSLKPGIFRPEGDDSYTHVIMPIRLQEEKTQ